MLCADFPDDVAAALLKVLGSGNKKRSDETIDFFEFLGGVNACLAFEELLGEVELLFDEHGTSQSQSQSQSGERGGGVHREMPSGAGEDVVGMYTKSYDALRNLSLEVRLRSRSWGAGL